MYEFVCMSLALSLIIACVTIYPIKIDSCHAKFALKYSIK